MKLNSDKCHLLDFWTKYEHNWSKISYDKIWESNKVKLLGLPIENKLKLEGHKPIKN